MGISVSRGKGQMNEPNVVPFVDILLVLIIIFMVITPLTSRGLNAVAPQAPDQASKAVKDDDTIVVQIECADPLCERTNLKINQKDVTWETLGPELTNIFKERTERVAFVKASENLDFAEVARAIDIAKAAGVDKVGLLSGRSTQ